MTSPQVVLAETYNAVNGIYFFAVHKGSHKPGLVERRFRADVKYWLMDARYYDQGELSIGNPPLVELVRELGSKNRPENGLDDAICNGVRNDARCSSGILQSKDRDSFDPLLQSLQTKDEAKTTTG
jgi:hypothetical protein